MFGIFRRLTSLSELLQLFALQTSVSVVAFARALSSIPGYTSRELRYEGLTAVNVRDVGANLWTSENCLVESRSHVSATVPPHVRSSAVLSQ